LPPKQARSDGAPRLSLLVLSDRPRPGYRDARNHAWPSRKAVGDVSRHASDAPASLLVGRHDSASFESPVDTAWPMDFCLTIGLRSETFHAAGESRGKGG
jgi:hypothetical protein